MGVRLGKFEQHDGFSELLFTLRRHEAGAGAHAVDRPLACQLGPFAFQWMGDQRRGQRQPPASATACCAAW
jgi:hypothetical protein